MSPGTALLQASAEAALWFALVALLARALPTMPARLRAALWWAVSLKTVAGLVLALAWPAPLELAVLPAGLDAWTAGGGEQIAEAAATGDEDVAGVVSAELAVAAGTAGGQGLNGGAGAGLAATGAREQIEQNPAAHKLSQTVPHQSGAVSTAGPGAPSPLSALPGVPTPAGTADGTGPTAAPWPAWLAPTALFLWLAGVLASLAVAAWRHRRQVALVDDARPVSDPSVQALLTRLADRFGVAPPELRSSPAVGSPHLTGLRRPCLLLPESCLPAAAGPGPTEAAAAETADADAEAADGELELILAHELAHLRRRDLLWGGVPALARALFFFHPLVRRAVDEYLLAREAACDSEALSRTGASPRRYGRLLLAWGTAPHLTTRTGLTAVSGPLAASLGGPRQLQRRLTMLLHDSTDDSNPAGGRLGRSARHLPWLIAGLLLLALVPLRLTAAPGPEPTPDPLAAVLPAADPGPAPEASAEPEPEPAPEPRPEPEPEPAATADDDSDQGASHNYVWSDNGDEPMVYLQGEGRSVGYHSSGYSWDRVRDLQRGGEPVLWFVRDGQEYVLRDAALLRQVKAAYAPVMELGRRQGELGGRQGELGAEQGELGGRQGKLGAEQGRLGAEQARLSIALSRAELDRAEARLEDRDSETRVVAERSRKEIRAKMDALQDEIRELADRQRELGDQQRELGDRQRELGEQQRELGEQQREASDEARTTVNGIIDRALAEGKADKVR